MTKDEALRLALEALELISIEFVCNGAHHAKKDRHEWIDPCPIVDRYKEAITSIKASLEAKDKLVANSSAWFALVMNAAAELEDASHCLRDEDAKQVAIRGAKYYREQAHSLYTTPPQRKPLTDEQIASIYMNYTDRPMHAQWDFARAIEATHGIKGEA